MITKIKKAINASKVMRDFAKKRDLVFFGNYEIGSDSPPVKGVTFHPNADDRHYMHGNIDGRDITALVRTTTLKHPHHKDERYTWTVMRLNLNVDTKTHIYIDAHHYDTNLYKNIFAKFARLRAANNVLMKINASFTQFFNVFAPQAAEDQLLLLLNDQIMQAMLSYFSNFDIEITDDELFIYMNESPTNMNELENMLKEGLWLAQHIEYHETYRAQLIAEI